MSWTTPRGITSCCCTNQCPQCGACCATGCEHRGTGRVVVTDHTTPLPPLPVQIPSVQTIHGPLTEERIREIVREEIAAAHPDDVVERLAGALIKGLGTPVEPNPVPTPSDSWRVCQSCNPRTACPSHRDEAAAYWAALRERR